MRGVGKGSKSTLSNLKANLAADDGSDGAGAG